MKKILIVLLIALIFSATVTAYEWAYTEPWRSIRGYAACHLTDDTMEEYDPMYDFNMDGFINFEDFALLLERE